MLLFGCRICLTCLNLAQGLCLIVAIYLPPIQFLESLKKAGDTCLISWEGRIIRKQTVVVILGNVSMHADFILLARLQKHSKVPSVNKWLLWWFAAYLSWQCRCMFVPFQRCIEAYGWNCEGMWSPWKLGLVYHYHKYQRVSRAVRRPVEVVDWVDEKAADPLTCCKPLC